MTDTGAVESTGPSITSAYSDYPDYIDLIRNIPGGVAVFRMCDGTFLFDFANDDWFRIHHMTPEYGRRYLGDSVLDMVAPSDHQIIKDEFIRVQTADEADAEREDFGLGNVDYRVIGQDGVLHWVNMAFRHIRTDGDALYYYSSCADIDSQKETEEALRESQLALGEAVGNSDIQFFTYLPECHRCEIYTLNNRFSMLPKGWDDFPEAFIAYTKLSDEDAAVYRAMVRSIDEGADEAECTVRFEYHGMPVWERVRIRPVRDKSGHLIKALGYSIDVTDRKNAEERLRAERVRLKALEGNVFEAFSFNLTKNSHPEIQTRDKAMLEGDVSDALLSEALRVAPALEHTNPDTREVLLRAAARIPDPKDRERFIATCSGDAVRKGVGEGKYNAEIRYRRFVGDVIHWVSSVAEVLPDPDSGDLIAFFYTRDVNEDVLDQELATRVIEASYALVAYIDLQTGRFHVRAGDERFAREHDGESYNDSIERASHELFDPDEADADLVKLSLTTIVTELGKTPVYTSHFNRIDHVDNLPGRPNRRMRVDTFYLDEHHDVVAFMLSDVTDLFEQERANRERLSEALSAAEQASVAKTEFLSRMSHEIRTPMNAIIGLDAIALQEKGISSSMEDHLQKIGISARFLLSLINDILDMSRIESGRMVLRKEPFDFEELIDGINTILYEQCRDSGLEYECILKSYTEDLYVGDATKLQQVLINILGNAVKFTPEGGKIHFMIEQVSRTKDKAKLRFEISDTGIGIDEKYLPHLFEAFSQENRGRTSAYGGSGLGLAISKNIVNLMGGQISVHSIKNVGSEFTVEIELGLTDEARRKHRQADPRLGKLFTLIVDDDIVVCQHTKLILDGAGFKTDWVDSGADAVQKVMLQHGSHKDYDLILLDWMMPDMDGIETAREIRKVVGPEVTIIIMTAYDWADIEKQAKNAGVDMFMKKPIFASSVMKAFENVFEHKCGQQEPEEEPPFDFLGKRILLVEDNVINAEIACNILEMRHCEVEVANNGAEAVESFAAAVPNHFDAILMDVRMPVMDGLEATRAIRAMRKSDSKTVPIIAMTANAFQEDVNQSLEAGMNAHLAKPIEPQRLYNTLEHFLRERQED